MLHDHVSFYLDFRLNCDVLFVSYNCNDLSNKTMFYLCMFRLIFISVLFICVYRYGSSGSDMDDSGSDDYEWISKAMVLLHSNQNNLFASALVASMYCMTYVDKNEARTPAQSGFAWTMEMLASEKMFRMSATLLYQLHDLLVSTYGLQSSLHMNSIESLAMFLVVCGHGMSNSALHGIFKHSGETVSRKFEDVLICLVSMSEHYIRPIDPNFPTTHSRITND